MSMAEDVAALLAGWREAAEASTEPDDVAFLILAADAMPRLVAAVEAALKTAGDWKRFAASGDAQGECADELRAAITAALLRKEGTRE
jgi:hypothetical protein